MSEPEWDLAIEPSLEDLRRKINSWPKSKRRIRLSHGDGAWLRLMTELGSAMDEDTSGTKQEKVERLRAKALSVFEDFFGLKKMWKDPRNRFGMTMGYHGPLIRAPRCGCVDHLRFYGQNNKEAQVMTWEPYGENLFTKDPLMVPREIEKFADALNLSWGVSASRSFHYPGRTVMIWFEEAGKKPTRKQLIELAYPTHGGRVLGLRDRTHG